MSAFGVRFVEIWDGSTVRTLAHLCRRSLLERGILWIAAARPPRTASSGRRIDRGCRRTLKTKTKNKWLFTSNGQSHDLRTENHEIKF